MNPRRAPLLLLAAVIGTAGCVYRPPIQQGNLLEIEEVDQVTPGMTRSQVRYVLGTPMVSDPFHPDRWDYVYSLKRGRASRADTAHFVVYFADDKVTRVEKLHVADAKPAGKKKDGTVDADREPPPAPSVRQPQPETRRPQGG